MVMTVLLLTIALSGLFWVGYALVTSGDLHALMLVMAGVAAFALILAQVVVARARRRRTG